MRPELWNFTRGQLGPRRAAASTHWDEGRGTALGREITQDQPGPSARSFLPPRGMQRLAVAYHNNKNPQPSLLNKFAGDRIVSRASHRAKEGGVKIE